MSPSLNKVDLFTIFFIDTKSVSSDRYLHYFVSTISWKVYEKITFSLLKRRYIKGKEFGPRGGASPCNTLLSTPPPPGAPPILAPHLNANSIQLLTASYSDVPPPWYKEGEGSSPPPPRPTSFCCDTLS